MIDLRERARLTRSAVVEREVRRSDRTVGAALVYHRVAATTGSPDREVSPALGRTAFGAELEYLLRRYAVVPPSRLPAAIAARRPGEPVPIALTFDDDTRSHVDDVLPVLASTGAVAGFYVAGWRLHGDPRPWWELLQLAADHGRLEPSLSPLTATTVTAASRREPGAIRRLARELELLEPEARRAIEADLAKRTDDLEADAGLDGAALRLLAQRHEIGFHTRLHDRLSARDDTGLEEALLDGRATLEEAIGRTIDSIAYPHGDADERVAAAARRAGYALGLAGSNRAATSADDRLLLPRLSPWHTTLGTFALTLARALASAPRAGAAARHRRS
jgi:peptidoglycan/xylan/chitin deacetylase (PgdA/CDA1 family)